MGFCLFHHYSRRKKKLFTFGVSPKFELKLTRCYNTFFVGRIREMYVFFVINAIETLTKCQLIQ